MNKIALFCSASDSIAPIYKEKAEELGAWMGEHHKWLIYGGANTGLMEVVAEAAKAKGAMLMGVVPTKLEERSMVSDKLDVTFHTVNLSDRKDIMLQEADVAVAFPGGVGTFDGSFHVIGFATIRYQRKEVIFFNIKGFLNENLHFFPTL